MNSEENFKRLKDGAKKHNADDLLDLGHYYHCVQIGLETPFDEESVFLDNEKWDKESNEIKMLTCYKLAEQYGNPTGSYEIGNCYFNGYLFGKKR